MITTLKLINLSCALLANLVQGIGEDKGDEFQDEPFRGNRMNFLGEEVGDTRKSSFNKLAVMVL